MPLPLAHGTKRRTQRTLRVLKGAPRLISNAMRLVVEKQHSPARMQTLKRRIRAESTVSRRPNPKLSQTLYLWRELFLRSQGSRCDVKIEFFSFKKGYICKNDWRREGQMRQDHSHESWCFYLNSLLWAKSQQHLTARVACSTCVPCCSSSFDCFCRVDVYNCMIYMCNIYIYVYVLSTIDTTPSTVLTSSCSTTITLETNGYSE